jgi:uncharacterized protein YoxC
MIIGLVVGVALVAFAIAVLVLGLRLARRLENVGDALEVTVDQLLDALVAHAEVAEHNDRAATAHERTFHALTDAIYDLHGFQREIDAQGEQLHALRKQFKVIAHDAARTNADATRILQKQYAQQADVDDILYHARHDAEARARGELNG